MSSEKTQEILSDPEKLREVALEAFKAVDLDHNGFLDRKEIKEVIIGTCKAVNSEVPSDKEINDIFDALDANGDGQISLDEFCVFIRSMLESTNA